MEKETKEKLFKQLELLEELSQEERTPSGVKELSIAMSAIAKVILEKVR